MSPLPVAARSLHRHRLRLRDFVLEQASLFPFFDREGRTRALMLVWPPARPIVVLEHHPDLVRVRWWGEIELDVEYSALRDLDEGRTAAAAGVPPEAGKWGTWHYDPWWVLREACFEGHPAVPALKATNCAGAFLKPVYGCFFKRDLSRLVGVTTKSKSHSGLAAIDHTFMRFKPGLLPERPAPAPLPPRRSPAWTLDPFWQHDGWRRSPSHLGRHISGHTTYRHR